MKGVFMSEEELRQEMVSLGASFYARGYAVGGAGNLSARLPDGNILTTPTNSCLGRLDAERLSKVTMDGCLISGEPMSKEAPFHLELYRQRTDCNAVVHLHSTYLTALSCREDIDASDVIRPFTPYYVMRVGRMPLLPYHRPGSPKIADELSRRAHESDAFLLANHGPVVLGRSLIDAVNNMEELEETARLIFVLGKAPVRYLSEEEIAELRK